MSLTFLNLPAPAANGSGAATDVTSIAGAKTLVVDGLDNGSFVLIEFSNVESPGPASWNPLVQFTRNGSREVNVAARGLRATTTNYRSGDVPAVQVGAEAATASFAELVPPAGNGVGSGVDVSALPPFKTVQVVGTYKGACNIEISNDGGASYVQGSGMSFQGSAGGGVRSAVVAAEYMRVSRALVPGAGADGTPIVNIGAVELDPTGGGGGSGGGFLIGSTFSDPIVGDYPTPVIVNAAANTMYVLSVDADQIIAVMLPAAPAAGSQVMLFCIGGSSLEYGPAIEATAAEGESIQGQGSIGITPPTTSYERHWFIYDGSGTWLHFAFPAGF